MASLALAFDILAKDRASGVFRDVGNAAERAGKQGHNAGSLISSGMKLAAAGLLGGGLIAGFKGLYDAAAESARIGRLTNQVISSTGGAANVTAKQVSNLATAISRKTGIDDEAIQSGQNLLLTFTNVANQAGKGNDIFNQATAILADMSVALGQDTTSSAIQLGKALNDPIRGVTALQRVGVSFTASQKEQIATLVESGRTMDAQRLILAELSKEFGGAAEAAATPFDKLRVTLGNLAEEAGSHLIPIVDGLANFFMDDLLPAVGNLEPVFDAFGSVLKFVADTGGAVLRFFNDLPGPIKAAAIAAGGFALLRGPLTSLFTSLRGLAETAALKMLYLRDSMSGIGSAAGAAKIGAGGLVGFLGGPWGAAITAATLGISLLVDWLGSSDEATKETTQATKDYADALREANGVITDNVRQQAAKSAQDAGVLDVADQLGISLGTVTNAITGQGAALASVRSVLQAYIDKHTEFITSGHVATTTLDEQGRAAQAAMDSLNSLAGQNGATASSADQLARATAGAGTAAGAAVLSQEQLTSQLEDTASAASDARSQADLFKQSLDILTGANVSLIQVESNFQEALARATDAIKDEDGAVLDAAGALNLHSENGRVASDVLLQVRDSGNQLISTMIQQGASEDEVRAKDAQLRKSFIDTARQMGIGQAEANKLADQILGIPAERTTTIKADTAPARAAINGLVNDYRGYTINLGLSANFNRFAAAAGGILPGFTPGRDVHRFMSASGMQLDLSGGESIMRPEWTRAVGSTFVGRMNKLARTGGTAAVRSAMGFAAGGTVPADWLGGMLFRTGINAGSLAAARGGMQDFARQFGSSASSLPGPGGPVQRWAGLVAQVLSILGQPGSLVGAVLQLIQHESGGNPRAINLWDINAQRGTPSIGLMQTIGPTFNAYAGPYRGRGIYDPLANIYAGLNYGMSRYGSVSKIPGIASLASGGRYRPYDNGGWLEPGYTLAYNGTGKPERVVGPNEGQNITVIAQFGSETVRAQAVRVVRQNDYQQNVRKRRS